MASWGSHGARAAGAAGLALLAGLACSSQERPPGSELRRDGGPVSPPASDAGPGPGAPTPDNNCGLVSYVVASRLPPDVLLVVDRSLAMNDPIAAGQRSKWSQLRAAIEGMLVENPGTIRWGLQLFNDGASQCGVATDPLVPVGLGQEENVRGALGEVVPGGGAPTAAAIRAAGAYLQAGTTPDPRFILLATDGRPDCSSSGDPGADEVGAAIQEITAQAAAGIKTLVLGAPTDGDATAVSNLNRMALAGGGARGDGVTTSAYTSLADATSLVQPLNTAGDSERSCTFVLPVPPPDPYNVRVLRDGDVVPPDDRNGWVYQPGFHTITLVGTACDQVRNGPATSLVVLYGCPARPVP